jgi:2-desacetyl-2-hydroxyethyl bacteriochlorophyllide A dehydrogenase
MKTKQVVVNAKEEVSLQEFPFDETNLQSNELIIETERSFISAGTELAIYTAADKEVYTPGYWAAYPFKSGYANVGMVLDAGAQYRHFVGRRVYTNGPHASLVRYATNLRNNLVAPVPENISLEEAVSARMAMVAISGLEASKPRYIRWVVIIGLGMVGNMAAQLYRITGAQVIGVDPSETRRRLARECGIPHVISGTEEEVAEQVRTLTSGRMAEVAVDAVGHSAIALQATKLTADGGDVVVLGSPRSPVSGNLTDVFAAAHYRWVSIKGALEWEVPTESSVPHQHTQQTRLRGLFEWIADGRLRLKPLITHVMPPAEIKAAYNGLLHRKDEFVGVVLNWKN